MSGITELRPALYRALMADLWQWRDHRGGGGSFTREVAGMRLAVVVKRGGAVELWVQSIVMVARFAPSALDEVVAAAATTWAWSVADAAKVGS